MTTPKFTAEERATLSENSKILLAMWEAEDRGDQAEADRLLSELEGPPDALMALKRSPGGADWIRRMNLNTRLADEKYGPGWLDRDETKQEAKVMVSEYTAGERAALSEYSQLVLAVLEAEDRGDQAEADRLLSILEAPAHTLMAIKQKPGGAALIRELNLNTRLADEKYGPGWLDQ